ncbi:hypothetical protein WJ972_26375 [Achromobacter insuavis]
MQQLLFGLVVRRLRPGQQGQDQRGGGAKAMPASIRRPGRASRHCAAWMPSASATGGSAGST